ncbi:sensor histidine kinase [Virgibacillus dakarensis]|uniref:histidine kinase n=1 Tax=Lentibacillus populi TaxID=1827502 RepID=A0A9W5X7A5_9BACI|nr:MULTISPECIES: HAMP domain-containing sensor histidine kinase [Bacillaceae]MTW86858.1 sensor histidine kinase [Virgibacillus dakarensis]GGB54419.1 two-component sensor histidine kinase [Lentibacillus populi]
MAMFWWIWLITAVGFFLLYLRERASRRAIRNDLAYINRKMVEFTDDTKPLTQESLLVVTNEPELRELLRVVNAIVDRARQSASDYVRMEREMRRMLSNVSHDLKTPLTVIMGYAEVLDRNFDLSEDERRRMLSQVYKKTTQVQELINAFFDLSKLESDEYDIPFSMVDACEVCRQRILVYFDLLSERDIKVDIRVPEEAVLVYANEEALSRILDNLLSNAIRYGSDGGYLGLSLISDKEKVQINVIDRGRGIEKVDQARVFERMYTMDDSRNRNIQGSGLGLAIAKRLTERLGGRIDLASIPNQRTCFTVTLPKSEFGSSQKGETDELRNK